MVETGRHAAPRFILHSSKKAAANGCGDGQKLKVAFMRGLRIIPLI